MLFSGLYYDIQNTAWLEDSKAFAPTASVEKIKTS